MTRSKRKFILGLAAASLLVPVASHAASLTVTQGDVMVSHGAGYKRVTGTVELTKGDSVVAKPGATASLAFGDACVVPLKSQAIFVVGDISPCAPHSAGRGASGATADVAPAVEGGLSSVMPIVLGAAVIGGAAALIANSSGGNSSSGGTAAGGGVGGGAGGGPGASP